MDEKVRCQSCGMPLSSGDEISARGGRIAVSEYCKFCYQDGAFTDPESDRRRNGPKLDRFYDRQSGFTTDEATQDVQRRNSRPQTLELEPRPFAVLSDPQIGKPSKHRIFQSPRGG